MGKRYTVKSLREPELSSEIHIGDTVLMSGVDDHYGIVMGVVVPSDKSLFNGSWWRVAIYKDTDHMACDLRGHADLPEQCLTKTHR